MPATSLLEPAIRERSDYYETYLTKRHTQKTRAAKHTSSCTVPMLTPIGGHHIFRKSYLIDEVALGKASSEETRVSGPISVHDGSEFEPDISVFTSNFISAALLACTSTMKDDLGRIHRRSTCCMDVGGDSAGHTLLASPAKPSYGRDSPLCR